MITASSSEKVKPMIPKPNQQSLYSIFDGKCLHQILDSRTSTSSALNNYIRAPKQEKEVTIKYMLIDQTHDARTPTSTSSAKKYNVQPLSDHEINPETSQL